MTLDARLSKIISELIDGGITLDQAATEFDQKYISTALARTAGNVTKAAQLLGVHRNTVHGRLRLLADERTVERLKTRSRRRG